MREDFGTQLRARRERLGLSLRAVASEVGVSASMLSQVETGKLHPSVNTLYQIAAFLDVSLDGLLGLSATDTAADDPASRRGPVQRAEDNPRVEIENGVIWERLAADPQGDIEPMLVTYEPGASTTATGRLIQHDGIEFGYLLEGQLILSIEFERRLIREGDSFSFRATRPHLFTNESKKRARGIWFTAPESAPTERATGASNSGTYRTLETIRALREGF